MCVNLIQVSGFIWFINSFVRVLFGRLWPNNQQIPFSFYLFYNVFDVFRMFIFNMKKKNTKHIHIRATDISFAIFRILRSHIPCSSIKGISNQFSQIRVCSPRLPLRILLVNLCKNMTFRIPFCRIQLTVTTMNLKKGPYVTHGEKSFWMFSVAYAEDIIHIGWCSPAIILRALSCTNASSTLAAHFGGPFVVVCPS